MKKRIMNKKKSSFRAVIIAKRHIAVLAAAFFVVLAAVAAVHGAKNIKSIEALSVPLSGKVVIVDPGHGGADAGASANGAVEKELNLKISAILQKYIEEGGGSAILTRTEDKNTADPNRAKGVSQKMSDLKERKKDIEDYKADIFVSIHMNKFEQSKYRGAQVFYTGSSEESKRLGETLQQSIKDVISDGNTRKAKPSQGEIYVLKNNEIPSALIECGFLSNADEAALLKDENYQRRIAWAIYLGIVRYFSR